MKTKMQIAQLKKQYGHTISFKLMCKALDINSKEMKQLIDNKSINCFKVSNKSHSALRFEISNIETLKQQIKPLKKKEK